MFHVKHHGIPLSSRKHDFSFENQNVSPRGAALPRKRNGKSFLYIKKIYAIFPLALYARFNRAIMRQISRK